MDANYLAAQRQHDRAEPEQLELPDPDVRLYSAGRTANLHVDALCDDRFYLALHNEMGSAAVFISRADMEAISDRINEALWEER